MIDLFVVTGIVLGVISIGCLFGAALIKRKPMPSLTDGAVAFLAGSAIVGGAKVCKFAVDPANSLVLGDIDRTFIFLGGLAVIWVSVSSIIGIIAKLPSRTH